MKWKFDYDYQMMQGEEARKNADLLANKQLFCEARGKYFDAAWYCEKAADLAEENGASQMASVARRISDECYKNATNMIKKHNEARYRARKKDPWIK